MVRSVSAIVLVLACLVPCYGQTVYGAKAGLVQSDSSDFWMDSGTGFAVGFTSTTRVSGKGSVQWELLLSKRGGAESGGGIPGSSAKNDPQLTYLDVPVSFRYRVNEGGAWHSTVYGGAFVGFKVSGDLSYRKAKSFDSGLLAGWEIAREATSGRTWYVDFRYAYGFVDTLEDHDSRSQSFFGTVGVRF